MNNAVKVILAVLFFICLFDMPYGYYQFVRFSAFVGFLFLAFNVKEAKGGPEAVVYIVLALLFQPFLKVALGRELWNIIDVIVGIGLILSIFVYPKKKDD